ncbi:MFS transporter [Peptococcaceae bacterium 1198_IL3148]
MKVSKFALPALAGVPLIMVLGNSLLIPVLPAIENALNITKVQASLLITLFSIPAGIVIPLAGFLSDRFGRKKVIIPALILYGLGGVIAGLAAIFLKGNAYTVILVGRVIQGIGAAGTAPIAMALCGDLWRGKERAKSLGVIEASNGMGKVISPILGALIGTIFWYGAFIFFPAVVIPVVLGMWFLVKEPKQQKEPPRFKKYVSSIKTIFKNKAPLLLSCFLAGATALSIIFGVLFFLSDYLERELKMDGVIKGAALAIPVLFMSTTSYLTGMFINKRVKLMKTLVVAGLVIIAISMGLLPLFENIYLFFALISLAGIGTGLVLPCLNMLITSSTATDQRGMVTSLYGSVRFFGVAFGPPIFGWLMDIGRSVMFWSATGLAVVAALLAFFFIKVTAIQEAAKEKPSGKPQETKREKINPPQSTSDQKDNEAAGGLLVYVSPKGNTTIVSPIVNPAKKPLPNQQLEEEVINGQPNNQ